MGLFLGLEVVWVGVSMGSGFICLFSYYLGFEREVVDERFMFGFVNLVGFFLVGSLSYLNFLRFVGWFRKLEGFYGGFFLD